MKRYRKYEFKTIEAINNSKYPTKSNPAIANLITELLNNEVINWKIKVVLDGKEFLIAKIRSETDFSEEKIKLIDTLVDLYYFPEEKYEEISKEIKISYSHWKDITNSNIQIKINNLKSKLAQTIPIPEVVDLILQ